MTLRPGQPLGLYRWARVSDVAHDVLILYVGRGGGQGENQEDSAKSLWRISMASYQDAVIDGQGRQTRQPTVRAHSQHFVHCCPARGTAQAVCKLCILHYDAMLLTCWPRIQG